MDKWQLVWNVHIVGIGSMILSLVAYLHEQAWWGWLFALGGLLVFAGMLVAVNV